MSYITITQGAVRAQVNIARLVAFMRKPGVK